MTFSEAIRRKMSRLTSKPLAQSYLFSPLYDYHYFDIFAIVRDRHQYIFNSTFTRLIFRAYKMTLTLNLPMGLKAPGH